MTAAAVRISPLAIVAGPWPSVPGHIEYNGFRIEGAQVGDGNGNFLIVDVTYSGAQPTQYHTLQSQSLSLVGNSLTITQTWQAPTLAAVKVILKAKLNDDATAQWIACRGSKTAQIETAYSNGVSAIDAASGFAGAISAYQNVVWP